MSRTNRSMICIKIEYAQQNKVSGQEWGRSIPWPQCEESDDLMIAKASCLRCRTRESKNSSTSENKWDILSFVLSNLVHKSQLITPVNLRNSQCGVEMRGNIYFLSFCCLFIHRFYFIFIWFWFHNNLIISLFYVFVYLTVVMYRLKSQKLNILLGILSLPFLITIKQPLSASLF